MNTKKWPVIGAAFVFLCSGNAYASFDRELENLNRQRSMQILDEFNEDIDRQIQTADLTPEQIRRSLREEELAASDQAATTAGSKKRARTAADRKPTIPKEQLREMLGLQMSPEQQSIPISVKTDIGMKTRRDSNVFERRIDAAGETEFSYYPSIKARTRQLGMDYSTDYTMNRHLFMNFKHNDRVDHKWSQSLLKKDSKTTWVFSSDMGASSIRTEDAVNKPSRYMTANFGPKFFYSLSPKTKFKIGYNRSSLVYLSDTKSSLDTRSHAIDIGGSYQITPKTSLNFGHIFRMSRPPKGIKSDNINFYSYYLGAGGRFSEKIFYNVQASLDYAKRSIEVSPMQESISYSAALTYAYSPKTRFNLNAQRARVADATETESDPDNYLYGFSVSHSLSPKITLSAGETIRLIIDDGALPTTVVDPDYAPSTVTANRSDVFWGTNAGVSYSIDPSSQVMFNYTYLDVDSNLKLNDRINHTCEVSYVKNF